MRIYEVLCFVLLFLGGHLNVESGLWGEVGKGAGDHHSGTLTHTRSKRREE